MIKNYIAGILVCCCATAFGQTHDPIGYYPGDGSVADVSAQHHPDASGYYSYEPGIAGQAFSFDGVYNYLELGTWFAQQSFSICFVMKDTATTDAPQKEGALIGGQSYLRSVDDYWDVLYTNGHYQVQTNNGGNPISFSVSKGAWHSIILTRTDLKLQLFVDGVLKGSSTGTSYDNFGDPDAPNILNRGIRMGASSMDFNHNWKGALDDLRFYDRPLTLDEIKALSKIGNAVLSISASDTTPGDPAGLIAHIGEDITYQFDWKNTGNAAAQKLQVTATIPTYIEDGTDLKKQFSPQDKNLSFDNTYGHYVGPSSPTAKDAKIIWNVSDLDPGFGQGVEMTVHLGNQVRNVQQIGLPNNYAVASTNGEPVTGATGFSSHAANLSIDIRSALRFTATPDVTTVAPGNYINYRLKLENLSPVAVTDAAAVFALPQFTRFAGFGLNQNGVPLKDPAGDPTGAFAPQSGSPDQVLIYFGRIGAAKSVSVTVTVQAQWVDPSEVAGKKLSLYDYGAAFLSGSSVDDFLAAIAAPSRTNYYSFINNANHSTALSGAGQTVTTQFKGSVANAPQINLIKAIKNDANDALNDGLGNAVDTVDPGAHVTYLFLISNDGESAAEDVEIQDAIPHSTSYVKGSAQILNTTESAIKSHLIKPVSANGTLAAGQVFLSAGHVNFTGLHLAPNDFLILKYDVKVASSTADLPVGTLLTTDSAISPSTGQPITTSVFTSSSPHTFFGVTLNGPLQIRGEITFAQPRVHKMLPNPEVSTDVRATQRALDAIYQGNPDAKPLTDPKDPLSFVPGMARFYVHYENLSSGPVSNVDLKIPIPAHTVFYRAAFVKLGVNLLKGADGIWPGKIDTSSPLPGELDPPDILSRGKNVTAHFATLPKGAKGDVMVEVIVAPDAIQADGSFTGTGKASDPHVVIYDNPPVTKTNPNPVAHVSVVDMPQLKVEHRAVASSAASPSATSYANFSTPPEIPIVPEIGVLKIAPTIVKAGENFEFTFVIFNSGNSRTPSCNFQFYQPAGTKFTKEVHTSSYNGRFVVDGVAAVPGTDLECFWDYIPAHSAVAVTYTLKASGKVNVPIIDLQDRVRMDYAGILNVTPSSIGVPATIGIFDGGDTSTYSVVGHSLNQFVLNGNLVAIIPLGNGKVMVEEPESLYHALGTGGNVDRISFGRNRAVFVGSGVSVGVGGTSADYLLTHRANGKLLAKLGVTPVQTTVPDGCLELVLLDQTAAAAGGGISVLSSLATLANGVISNDGGSLISQDGGGIVSHSAGGVISNDGGSLISQDGGSVISNDGGSLISQDGGGITSLPNTSSLVASGGGNLTVQGGGSFSKIGQGN